MASLLKCWPRRTISRSGNGSTECPVWSRENRGRLQISYQARHPFSAGKASSSLALWRVRHRAVRQQAVAHGTAAVVISVDRSKMSQPGCTCPHKGMATFASPGGGRGQGTVIRDWNPRGKEVVEVVVSALQTCQPLPPPVTCRDCGQGCRRSGDRGGICDHSVLVHQTSNHLAFHNWGNRKRGLRREHGGWEQYT